MKKIFYFSILLLLTGCTGLPKGVNTSSKCIYELDGLSCKREQVWQMRDNSGQTLKVKHTNYWFETNEDCMNFIKDIDNKDLLLSSNTGKICDCGATGKNGSSADVVNYYIYSDGKYDGDFYYKVTAPFIITKDNGNEKIEYKYLYNQEEYFYAMFTSRSALEKFKNIINNELSSIYGYSTNHVIRIKIKRMY